MAPDVSLEMFPKRLKELREKHSLSQAVLSELCGFGSARVYHWEHSGRAPNIEDAARLADFFNVSLDYLCGGSEQG